MNTRNLLPDAIRGTHEMWGPMNRIGQLQRRLNRMFGDFLEEPFSNLAQAPKDLLSFENRGFEPACDIEETESQFLLNFDLPGVKKEDVKIEIQDGLLTVSGERKREVKGQLSRERYHGMFCRSFTLPSNAGTEKMEAAYDSGVLQIMIPKTAASHGKKIPIREGKLLQAKSEKAA